MAKAIKMSKRSPPKQNPKAAEFEESMCRQKPSKHGLPFNRFRKKVI